MDSDRDEDSGAEGFAQLSPELEARVADVRKRAFKAAVRRRGLSHDEAEDIAQAIELSVRKRLVVSPRFLEDEEKRGAYVATAVKNKVIDLRRAWKAAINRMIDVRDSFYSRRSEVFNPTRFIDHTDLSLEFSIHSLPRQVRQIIDLYYYDDRSETQIAQMLGITPQSVHTQRKRGLAKAKVAFLRHEYGPPPQWHKLNSPINRKPGK